MEAGFGVKASSLAQPEPCTTALIILCEQNLEKNNEEQNLADSWVLLWIFTVGAADKNLPSRLLKNSIMILKKTTKKPPLIGVGKDRGEEKKRPQDKISH